MFPKDFFLNSEGKRWDSALGGSLYSPPKVSFEVKLFFLDNLYPCRPELLGSPGDILGKVNAVWDESGQQIASLAEPLLICREFCVDAGVALRLRGNCGEEKPVVALLKPTHGSVGAAGWKTPESHKLQSGAE